MRKVMLVILLVAATAWAQDPNADAPAPPAKPYQSIDALRRGAPLEAEPAAAPMARVENVDVRRKRSYPMQPPTIPHAIDGYQIDKNSNRCMLCHGRSNAETFQAPSVSVTHYMDREQNFLAEISPRRYFCTQCHVVQTDAKPLVESRFEDVDALLGRPAEKPRGPTKAPDRNAPQKNKD